MVHCSLNKIKLAFDVHYKIVIFSLLTFSLCGIELSLSATCLALASRVTGHSLENVGFEPIPACGVLCRVFDVLCCLR